MTAPCREMPRYRCHKEVWALKIADVRAGRADGEGPGQTLVFVEAKDYAPLSVDEAFVHKHKPEPGTYYVVYKDGYRSISPAEAFEDGYTLVA